MATEEKKFINPAVKSRIERINDLFNDIKNNTDNNPLDVVIAKYSIRTGLQYRKVTEYLKLLEVEGKIKIDWTNNSVQLV